MKKSLLILSAILMLSLMAGCNSNPDTPEPANNVGPVDDDSLGPVNQEGDTVAIDEQLAGLIKDQYEELHISAVVLPRNAILPGSSIPVTVNIENTGDKTVNYVQGSGSFSTPQSLYLSAQHLQPVVPEDNLGIMTMDYVVKQLEPGESISFIMMLMAIEPDENFRTYTYDLFMEDGTYIADLSWVDLSALYPDLVATEPGSYGVYANFLYSVVDDEAGDDELLSAMFTSGATGYAQAELTIGVS